MRWIQSTSIPPGRPSAGGPAGAEVAGIGAFWREALPPMRVEIARTRVDEAWLPAIPGGLPAAPAGERDLCLGATHRYARHLGPGAWWEI